MHKKKIIAALIIGTLAFSAGRAFACKEYTGLGTMQADGTCQDASINTPSEACSQMGSGWTAQTGFIVTLNQGVGQVCAWKVGCCKAKKAGNRIVIDDHIAPLND